LLLGEIFIPDDGRPGGSRVPAMQKLLINGFVASTAVCRCNGRRDYESIMIRPFLALRHLVAIQAIKPLLRVRAHLEFVHYRVLSIQMALRTLAARPHKRRARLLYDHPWPARIDEVGRKNQSRRMVIAMNTPRKFIP